MPSWWLTPDADMVGLSRCAIELHPTTAELDRASLVPITAPGRLIFRLYGQSSVCTGLIASTSAPISRILAVTLANSSGDSAKRAAMRKQM